MSACCVCVVRVCMRVCVCVRVHACMCVCVILTKLYLCLYQTSRSDLGIDLDMNRAIEYKIATFAYHHFCSSLHTLLSYLSALLCTHQTSHTLWSSSKKHSKIPKRSLKYGGCLFSFVVPAVGNSLPARLQDLPTPSSKPSSRLFSLDSPFHKPRWTIPMTINYVDVKMYLCV